MDEKERQQEENLSALLKAGYPEADGVDPRSRAVVYSRLAQTLPIRPAFPASALGLLCAGLFLLEILAAGVICGLLPAPANDLLALLTGGIVTLNLSSLPIAAILIVNRRKHA